MTFIASTVQCSGDEDMKEGMVPGVWQGLEQLVISFGGLGQRKVLF